MYACARPSFLRRSVRARSRARRAGWRRSKPLPLRAPAAAARVHQLGPCRTQACLFELFGVSEPSCDMARLCLLLGQDEGDRLAAAACSARAARAVDVVLVLARR